LHSTKLPPGRSRHLLSLALALLALCLLVAPLLRAYASPHPAPADSAEVGDPLGTIAQLREKLSSSSEPYAKARLADLDRLLETARTLRRSDGRPIEVRSTFRSLSEGIEAEVVAVSNEMLEISINEACRVRPAHVAVSYLHELTHVAQFAEGRLGYAAPKAAGATRWQAVGNDAVDEAEAYAESFWIAGTTAVECPENLWGFLAAYHEGWDSLLTFVRRERPTLPAYEVRPPHDAKLLLSAYPYAELSLHWFLGSVAVTGRNANRTLNTGTVNPKNH